MTNNNEMEITFTHPRQAKTFVAKIRPECTGQQAIRGMIVGDDNGPFLSPDQNYELAIKQSEVAITPNMTFREAGVVDGEVIEVRLSGRGADTTPH